MQIDPAAKSVDDAPLNKITPKIDSAAEYVLDTQLVAQVGSKEVKVSVLIDSAAERLLEPPEVTRRDAKNSGNRYTDCPCGLPNCTKEVHWNVRYLEHIDCFRKKSGFKKERKKVASSTAKGGLTTVTESTYSSDETVDPITGLNTGKLIRFTGSKITDEMRISSKSRRRRDFPDWLASLSRYRGYHKAAAKRQHEDLIENETENERLERLIDQADKMRRIYRRELEEGILIRSRKPSNNNGGWTEERRSHEGIINKYHPESTLETIIEEIDEVMEKEGEPNRSI